MMLLAGCHAQSFAPGRTSPRLVETHLTPSQIQEVLNTLQQHDDWYFIPMLTESDADLSRYSEDVKRQLAKIGSFIYGPSTIYSHQCPLYASVENATKKHHDNMKTVMEERFGWLLDHIRQVLAEAVAPDPVEWISYPYFKMHRGDSLDNLPDYFQKMALQPAPPHRDQQFTTYVEKELQPNAATLTFTLPFQVPSGGAGLRVFDAFFDKKSGTLVNQEGKQLPYTGKAYKKLVETMSYEDVTYLPGRMLLFTGDQLHSVSTLSTFSATFAKPFAREANLQVADAACAFTVMGP
eukprot:symbB.v1.2.023116.t2/scaffold2087.1/size89970/1